MELQIIHNNIFELRGMKVMLDFHLAELYEIETKNLNKAVKRNADRFPADFMFRLSKQEYASVRFQIGTLETDNLRFQSGTSSYGGRRYLPYAFTEQGVAMLSSVINSQKAIHTNISIMRAFVAVRQFALNYKELDSKIKELESKYDKQFNDVFQVIDYLATAKQQQEDFANREPIGFIKPKPNNNATSKSNLKKKK